MNRGGKVGVAHERVLGNFVDALINGDDDRLHAARSQLERALGPAGLADTAAVAGQFNCLNRVAGGIGIPLDFGIEIGTRHWHKAMGTNRFVTAQNTPAGGYLATLRAILLAPSLYLIRNIGWSRSWLVTQFADWRSDDNGARAHDRTRS